MGKASDKERASEDGSEESEAMLSWRQMACIWRVLFLFVLRFFFGRTDRQSVLPFCFSALL